MKWNREFRPFVASTGLLAVCCGLHPGGALPPAAAGQADTVLLQPSADTSIFSEGELSNGGGIYLFTGLTVVGAERRALLAFDLSAIPAGAEITSASLDVTVSRTISQTITVRMHRLLAGWTEGSVDADGQEGTGGPAEAGDATWLQRGVGAAWTNPGGDFVAAESARAGLRVNGRYRFAGGSLAEDVQRWVDNPQENHGWILVANPAAGFGSAKRLNSSENPDLATRPVLTVAYTAPASVPPAARQIPVGGGWWLVLLGAGLLLLGRPFVRR